MTWSGFVWHRRGTSDWPL